MTNRRETPAEARASIRAAVEYLDDEERWNLLQRFLEKETGGRSVGAERSLRLEVLRSMVCPRVGDQEWDRILREHRKARWRGELRLANSAAMLSARGRSAPVPGDTKIAGLP